MQEKSRILIDAGKSALRVPEGYFEGLRERLETIPEAGRAVSPAQRLKPYLAIAACFVALLVAGNAVLRGTAGKDTTGDIYEELGYVSLLQANEYLNSEPAEQDTITDEDVINYLIDSGTSAELIEYTGLIAKK